MYALVPRPPCSRAHLKDPARSLAWSLARSGSRRSGARLMSAAGIGADHGLDVALCRRAATGDARAQGMVARRVLARVRNIARSLATRAADADDAAQYALLEVLRSCKNFAGRASLEAWAARIATRATLRHLARERRHQTAGAPEALSAGVEPPHSPLAETLPRSLREYLRELPEPQRTALVLHHALGHTLEEIAELTDVSRNTVKGRLRLGMAALRKRVRREQRLGAPQRRAP